MHTAGTYSSPPPVPLDPGYILDVEELDWILERALHLRDGWPAGASRCFASPLVSAWVPDTSSRLQGGSLLLKHGGRQASVALPETLELKEAAVALAHADPSVCVRVRRRRHGVGLLVVGMQFETDEARASAHPLAIEVLQPQAGAGQSLLLFEPARLDPGETAPAAVAQETPVEGEGQGAASFRLVSAPAGIGSFEPDRAFTRAETYEVPLPPALAPAPPPPGSRVARWLRQLWWSEPSSALARRPE